MSGSSVHELIAEVVCAQSAEALHAACSRASRRFGFDHFLYASRIPSAVAKPYRLLISAQPDAWRERYAAKRYIAVDPTVRHCATRVRPLVWDELLREPWLTRQIRRFMADARRHGLVSGVTLPLRGVRGELGLLTFTSGLPHSRARPAIVRHLADMHLFAAFVQETAGRLSAAGGLPSKPSELTPRERECLLWAAEGKTSWETSQILGISERTAIFHLRNAAEKLNVASRQQAVARAIAQGLIAPRLF